MAPTTQALSLDLMEIIHKVLLIHDPIGELTDALLTSAIAADNKGIAPLGLAINPHVIVVLLEVYHCGSGLRPVKKIAHHTIYLLESRRDVCDPSPGLHVVPHLGGRNITLPSSYRKGSKVASYFNKVA